MDHIKLRQLVRLQFEKPPDFLHVHLSRRLWLQFGMDAVDLRFAVCLPA